jgi:hypothetical protein
VLGAHRTTNATRLLPLLAMLVLGCGGHTSASSTPDGGAGAADAQGTPAEAAADAFTPGDANGGASPDAGDAGPTGDGGCVARVPQTHRPAETSCPSGSGACTVDSDCSAAADGVCACSGQVPGGNTCVYGNCRVDSDCGDGGFCSPSVSTGCNYPACGGYFCHTCADQCVDDSDCPESYACGYGAGAWVCIPPPMTG